VFFFFYIFFCIFLYFFLALIFSKILIRWSWLVLFFLLLFLLFNIFHSSKNSVGSKIQNFVVELNILRLPKSFSPCS